jgi:hypothetical protein
MTSLADVLPCGLPERGEFLLQLHEVAAQAEGTVVDAQPPTALFIRCARSEIGLTVANTAEASESGVLSAPAATAAALLVLSAVGADLALAGHSAVSETECGQEAAGGGTGQRAAGPYRRQ